MADSELGELRRPPRLPEQRVHRLASWRAQGLAGGTNDDVTPTDGSDDVLASDGGGEGDGGELPSWYADSFDVTSATTSVVLTNYPLPRSEVVRLNGVTLEPDVDYTIASRTVTIEDPPALFLGIGAATWDLVVSYAYIDSAAPTFEIAYVFDGEDSTLPEDVVDGMVGFLFTHAAITSISGGFATWEQLYEGPSTSPFDTDGRRLRVYRGTGVSGTPGSVSISDSGAWLGRALVVLRDCPETAYVTTGGVDLYHSGGTAVSNPITVAGTADEGKVVVCTIRAADGAGECYPGDGTAYVDTGFSGTHLRSGVDFPYGHSVGVSVGIADGGSFSTAFDMTEIDGYAQAAAFVIEVG